MFCKGRAQTSPTLTWTTERQKRTTSNHLYVQRNFFISVTNQAFYGRKALPYPHQKLPKISVSKIEEKIFIGAPLRILGRKRIFDVLLKETESSTWEPSKVVVDNFLCKCKAPIYTTHVENMPEIRNAAWHSIKMSTRKTPGGKDGRCVRVTILPPS